MRQRINHTKLLLIAMALIVAGCYQPEDGKVTYDEEMGSCSIDVGLTARAESDPTESPVNIFGTTNAPDGVTIRAIYVGGTMVPRTEYNYRSWTVSLNLDLLKALAVDGEALIPVVAITSSGCQELTGEDRPLVRVPPTAPDAGNNEDGECL